MNKTEQFCLYIYRAKLRYKKKWCCVYYSTSPGYTFFLLRAVKQEILKEKYKKNPV